MTTTQNWNAKRDIHLHGTAKDSFTLERSEAQQNCILVYFVVSQ